MLYLCDIRNRAKKHDSSTKSPQFLTYELFPIVLCLANFHNRFARCLTWSQRSESRCFSQDKLFGTVFAGASKFYCRDCGSAFNTLVELTVHMNKTGHFRDTNTEADKLNSASGAAQ